MGATSYSDAVYTSRLTSAADAGTDLFTHDADIRSGSTKMCVHEKLDPAKVNAAGKIIRESFDSEVHPDSRAVAVLFDVTGSMATVPRQFVLKLDKLMASLVKKGFLEHPHILFGAVGDATVDKVPLQIGQFEGGNEMDEALSLIVLEGGGGGHNTESYELGMYFAARHTNVDCYEKRGQKAYLFIMGDEMPYPNVKASEVKAIIGDKLQSDIPLEEILAELREKFEVFWVMPGGTNHWDDEKVEGPLRKMFGQSFLKLSNPEDVCELITSTIGVAEGYDLHDVSKALKDVGADADAVGRASKSLVAYATSRALAKGATVTGALVESGEDSVAKL